MTTFLKGDTTAAITLALADGFDYSGKTVNLEYQGVRRTFTGCVAGGALTFAFAAEETAPMSLGAYPVRVWIEGGGEVLTVHNADVKLRVTDCIADVHGGGAIYLDVHGGLHGIEGLPERFTDEDLRSKVNEIVRRLGGAVAIAVLALLPAFGSTVEVLTAPKGAIYNDQPVVTNVTLDGLVRWDNSSEWYSTLNLGGAWLQWPGFFIAPGVEGFVFGHDLQSVLVPDGSRVATSNMVEGIVGMLPPTDLTPATNYANRALGAFASTGAVARATVYGTPTRWTDATGCVWEVVTGWRVYTNGIVAVGWTAWGSEVDAGPAGYSYELRIGPDETEGIGIANATFPSNVQNWADEYETTYDLDYDFYGLTYGDTIRAVHGGTNFVGRVAMTNDIPASLPESDPTVPEWAKAANPPAYTASDIGAYPYADGNSLANIVNSWEGYWSGTNVMFEVTNYFGNTTGELPRLRIRELRGGVWTNVWDEAHKFDVCKGEILGEVAASNTALKAEIADGYAPKAWGAFTDKGETNVVGNSVWMTSPETYFAGGTEYQRVAVGAGVVCVLVDNGAGAYTAGEDGTFRFQDEGGTNYFGFAKSASYTIGCRTDGIAVEGNLVTLRYDVIMGGTDVPVVYWRLALGSGEWVQLNNVDGTACAGAPYSVTWYTSGGSYYAAINCGSNGGGFFKAETSVAGDVVFETNMKARLGGGIECTNTQSGVTGIIRPSYNGSTVTWSWSAR